MTLKERFEIFDTPEYYSRVDAEHILELYIGLDEKGQKYLRSIKKDIKLPVITNISKSNIKYLKLELRVDSVYNLITDNNSNIYDRKPIIKTTSK